MTASIAALQSSADAPALPGAFAGTDAADSDGDFSFHDLVSIVNPLQHIPIVSTLYRAITGDSIKPLERIAGDTLYGGAWGFVSSVANLAFKDMTGKDFGETALALVEGDDTTAVADNVNDVAPVSSSMAVAAVSTPASNDTAGALAANGPPMPLQSSKLQAPATTNDAAMLALMNSMSNKGIDPTLRQKLDTLNGVHSNAAGFRRWLERSATQS